MRFAPRPENDFAEFIHTYYRECRYRFDRIEAIAGKWMFRDLIPGMSDFDARLLLADDMDVADWCELSTVVGEVHLQLCRRYPCWARNFEHLPGINLTWSELAAETSYYPEYQQWTYYHSERPDQVSRVLDGFARRPWDRKDEYFHLKKFCLYYGRYDRAIDPPINLGVHANKYPLHSRVMHYFNPPVMSAVCLLEQRNLPGKMDAFEVAAQRFPGWQCWDLVRDILHAGYETPAWYAEPRLTQLEDALEEGLAQLAEALRPQLTLVPAVAGTDIAAWKAALRAVPLDPALVIFDNAKFSRLMKGRLRFYCQAPAWFDTTWLIRNELKRIGANFFREPFRTWWRLRSGEDVADPLTILDRLQGEVLTAEEVAATRRFAALTRDWQDGREREAAAAIADEFDGFYHALARIAAAASTQETGQP